MKTLIISDIKVFTKPGTNDIDKVLVIPFGAPSNPEGQKRGIWRTAEQWSIDMRDSFPNIPASLIMPSMLVNGKLSGEVEFQAEGHEYALSEKHRDVLSGEANAGDIRKREADGYYVDKFLKYSFNQEAMSGYFVAMINSAQQGVVEPTSSAPKAEDSTPEVVAEEGEKTQSKAKSTKGEKIDA